MKDEQRATHLADPTVEASGHESGFPDNNFAESGLSGSGSNDEGPRAARPGLTLDSWAVLLALAAAALVKLHILSTVKW